MIRCSIYNKMVFELNLYELAYTSYSLFCNGHAKIYEVAVNGPDDIVIYSPIKGSVLLV